MGCRLIILFFLLLHVRFAACSRLPAPSSVSISSYNMEHALGFLPGPETPAGARFAVQVHSLRRGKWWSVSGCSQLADGQKCNLTRAFKEYLGDYQARVRAFTPTRTSNWTLSRWFQPLSDTVLGPPDVSLSGCGNCLLIRVGFPASSPHQEQLNRLYDKLHLHVHRVWDGSEFQLILPFKEENVVTYLQPGVEYCLSVSVNSLINSNSVASEPTCTFTSPPPSRIPQYLLWVALSTLCVLGFLLTALVVYSGKVTHKLQERISAMQTHNP